jgi:citrate lyase beta subunit
MKYFKHEDRVIPDDAVIRINLAWEFSLDQLREDLRFIQEIGPYDVWLDDPVGRKKPPNNRYTIDELTQIVQEFPQVKYIAVSNVESPQDLQAYLRAFPDCNIVPKIESRQAIFNLGMILRALPEEDRYLMLDREDLFSDFIRKGKPSDGFLDTVQHVHDLARGQKTQVLELKGVVFSES